MATAQTYTQRMRQRKNDISEALYHELNRIAREQGGQLVSNQNHVLLIKVENPGGGPDYVEVSVKNKL